MLNTLAKVSLLLLEAANLASACMSDSACRQEGMDVTACCYMNECVPGDSLGCTNDRLNFYSSLQGKLKSNSQVDSLVETLRMSQKVQKCDEMGIHCIDFVSELLTDSSATFSPDSKQSVSH